MRIHKTILFHLAICLFLTGLFLPSTSQAYVESFENGIPGSWITSGDGAWNTTTSSAQDGTTSLQSPTITHEQSATLQTIRSCATGNITFYYKISTEENNDQLQFYIDGELIDSLSGEQDWIQISYPVTAGLHTFTWIYSKDLNFSEGDDSVWLDQVRFPNLKVETDYWSSIYIHTDGSLWAWGRNDYGQLGDGTMINRLSPVQIGSDTDWAQVALGPWHVVAIKTDGTLWVWGLNYYGQLGDGTTTDRLSPVQIGSDADWAQISVNGNASLAIKTDGTLWAWGDNSAGQFGDGTTTDCLSPVPVGSDTDWAQVASSGSSTLAIKTNGTLWAWGLNHIGQLGDGTTTSRLSPVRVGSDTDWAQVAAGGFYTMAIKTDSTLWGWGENQAGQLGDGTTTNRLSPVQVGTDTDWAQVAIDGQNQSMAIKTNSTLWGWGYVYLDGTVISSHNPVQIGTDTDWAQVSIAIALLAIKTDGTLWVCGLNSSGQVGDGTTITSYTLTLLPAFAPTIDTDSDGISDSIDAFPIDPAASVDTDGDGHPDSWNNGYTQSDSTTGLTLDAFPNDITEWSDSDNDGIGDNTDPTVLSDNAEFIKQVYRDFLGREADSGGLSYWTDQLSTGAVTRAELVEQYLLSAEFGDTVAPVTRLYFAYFNRIPDYSGLMYWIDSYKQGSSLASISDAFAGSAEFTSTYGSLSNGDFVTLVYQNVLDRDPDTGGLDYWTGLLDSSTQTRGQVMIGFSESIEYQDLMASSIYTTMTYIGLLRRAPDQGGFDYWTGVLDAGASGTALINGFLYATEYQGRFNGTWVISTLEISGPGTIEEESTASYIATATWENGRSSLVGAEWSVNSSYASISSTGVMTTTTVSTDTGITLSASYVSGGQTETDTHSVTIENEPLALSGLTISGSTSVNESSVASFTAIANWNDGSNSIVTPSWSENSAYATINSSGTLTTSGVNSNQPVTITASYTYSGVTRTDTHAVTILNDSAFTVLNTGVSYNLSINAWGSDIYQFTAPETTRYQIALTNTQSDLSWVVADNYQLPATILGECDNSSSATNEICTTVSNLIAGETYYLAIDEWDDVSGSYTLRIDPL